MYFDATILNNNSLRITKGEDELLKREEELPLNHVVENSISLGLSVSSEIISFIELYEFITNSI